MGRGPRPTVPGSFFTVSLEPTGQAPVLEESARVFGKRVTPHCVVSSDTSRSVLLGGRTRSEPATRRPARRPQAALARHAAHAVRHNQRRHNGSSRASIGTSTEGGRHRDTRRISCTTRARRAMSANPRGRRELRESSAPRRGRCCPQLRPMVSVPEVATLARPPAAVAPRRAQSARSASTGSSRAARRAGAYVATTAIARSVMPTTPSVSGSPGPTPKSRA